MEEHIQETPNDRLRLLREKLNKTQIAMANELSLRQSYYSDLENKRRNVSAKLIQKIKEVYGVSSDWMHTGNGNVFISNGNKMHPKNVPESVPQDRYMENMDDKALTKSDLVYMMEALANSVYKGDSKVEYYFKHPASKLSMIFNNLRTDLETAYNDYFKLIEVSNKFGAPDFMDEKFPNNKIDFKTYLKNTDTELELDNEEVTDKKLLKCIKIVDYERLISAHQGNISDLINYMNRYYDLYDSVFEKYHSDAVKAKKSR